MTAAPSKPTVAQRFGSHLRRMPAWQRLVLLVSLLAGTAGGVGSLMSYFAEPAAGTTESGGVSVPASARGVIDPSLQRETAPVESPGFWQRMAPHARNFGFSVVIGFIAGFFFRMFLKTMAFITAIVVVGFFLLSYFNVLNVDVAGMKTQYDGVMHWLTENGSRLKDAVVGRLPSTVGAGLGGLIGFLRR